MASLQILGFLLLAISVTSIAHVIDDIATSYKPYYAAWTAFKIKFARSYTGPEETQRKHTFVEWVKKIEAHNQRYENNEETYTMGINQFTDSLDSDSGSCHVDDAEVAWNGAIRHKRQTGFCREFSPPTNYKPPNDWDWRKKGAVTPVKDQGQCGSCYAFGVTTTISAQLHMKTGTLTALSEQQVVDCSGGCGGSNAETSFKYINVAGGIVPSAMYPYQEQASDRGLCTFAKYKHHTAAIVTGCQYSNTETSLKSMVAYLGPVYVSIAVIDTFRSYKVSGNVDVLVYTSRSCPSSSRKRHCLTVVGYGSHEGTDYWIVKNSWGTDWGKQGYGFIERGRNLCGIGNKITVPEVDSTVPEVDGSTKGAACTKNIAFWPPSFLILLAFCLVAA